MPHALPLKSSRIVHSAPIFYGWIVVAAAMVGMAMTLPGQTMGISLFIDSIIADLGLSRSKVSFAYTAANLAAALALPFVGRAIDQYGPRRAVVVIAAAFACACFWVSGAQGIVTLFLGFLMLRALGPGALNLVSLHVVNIWFIRRRGTAVGWIGVGLAAATAVFPLLVEPILPEMGWRQVFILLGLSFLVIMLPVGALFFRDKPEHFGLVPDGGKVEAGGYTVTETDVSLAQARRHAMFWLLTGGGISIAAFSTGLMFHHFSILESSGVNRATAALFFVPFGFVTAAANLSTGYLMDRLSPRHLLAVLLLVFGTMLLLIPLATTSLLVWTYGCLFGVAQGMSSSILGSGYAYYYGRAHIGAIRGYTQTLFVAGAAFGPLVYAVGFDFFGSYTLPLALTATVPVAIGGLALLSRYDRPVIAG